MKKTNCLIGFLAITFTFYSGVSVAQNVTTQSVSGSSGMTDIPKYLMDQYNAAKDSYNGEEKQRVMTEMEKYLSVFNLNTTDGDYKPVFETDPPFTPDWYSTDVTVYTGNIANYGYRQIDLKRGEDGWMYLALNRRFVSGTNGRIDVYRSSNGGVTWSYVNGVTSVTSFFQSVSMLVENRSLNNTIPDSTRIFIYFIAAPATNFNSSVLAVASFRRNGTGWFGGTVHAPAAGNKYEYVTTCSDGVYYELSTYMHIFVHEATNSNADVGFRHFLTTSWGASYITDILNSTLFNDINPSAQYADLSGNDEIWFACERVYSSTHHRLVLYTTPEIPSSSYSSVAISTTADVLYEKPELTIVQQIYTVPRQFAVTATLNNNPRWFFYNNGAWGRDILLGPNSTCLASFTTCSSDSNTVSGGPYLLLGYASSDGDSVNLKRTTIPPVFYFPHNRINSHNSTGVVAPSSALYKVGNNKYASVAFVGSGPANVYYNSEQLLTGIEPVTGIPDKFELGQNYPNPFNPKTKIDFSIPGPGLVKLTVYDLTGREVSVLIDKEMSAGAYTVEFSASNLASGVYFYKMVSGDFSQVKKMILVK